MKKALLIGINYVGTPSELGGCVNDVENMEALIKSQCPEMVIRKLTDTSSNKDVSSRPTRENILREIKWLMEDLNVGIFHYSGHGSHIRDLNGDEVDGRDEVICPVDGGYISDDELRKVMVEKVPAGAKLHCIMDCCFSGTVMDLRYQFIDKKHYSSKRSYYNYPETAGIVVCISGCSDRQTSADTVDYDMVEKHYEAGGAMTFALLRALAQGGSYCQVIREMRKSLRENNYSQVPQLCFGKKMNLNNQLNLF